jgi:hypothetical protein
LFRGGGGTAEYRESACGFFPGANAGGFGEYRRLAVGTAVELAADMSEERSATAGA